MALITYKEETMKSQNATLNGLFQTKTWYPNKVPWLVSIHALLILELVLTWLGCTSISVFSFGPFTTGGMLSCSNMCREEQWSWWRDSKISVTRGNWGIGGCLVQRGGWGMTLSCSETAWEGVAARRMSVSFPGWQMVGHKETASRCGHGTKGHGLVIACCMSGWWLSLVILKFFSNLDDSVSLWFYDGC